MIERVFFEGLRSFVGLGTGRVEAAQPCRLAGSVASAVVAADAVTARVELLSSNCYFCHTLLTPKTFAAAAAAARVTQGTFRRPRGGI